MNRLQKYVAAGVCGALMLALALPASAQPQAAVTGTVMDPLGARVPGARVALTGGGPARRTTSGADGSFRFDGVPAGVYQVTTELEGFQPYASAPVYVGAGASQVLDVTLQLSPLEQAVVVTAAAAAVVQAQTGAPVTVIDAAALDVRRQPDVLDALRQVPGGQIVQAGARGAQTSFFIRGGNANFNKVLIDGAVANDIGGGFDFAQLSTAGIDRVEVLRQTNSVMYGSDALAGVVSLTTRRGRTRAPEVAYAAEGGNLGTWSSDAGIGGVLTRFNYYSTYRRFETDNDVPNSDSRNGTYAGRFGVALGTNTDVSGTIRRTDTDSGSPNAFALFGIADDARSENAFTYASAAVNSQWTNRWQTSVRYGYTDQTSRYRNPAPTGEAYDPFGFGANYLGRTVTLTGANGYAVTGRAILDFGGVYPSLFESRTTRQAVSGETTLMVHRALSIAGGGRFEREEGRSRADAPQPDASRHNGGAFVEARGTLQHRHFIAAGVGVEHNAVFGEAVTPRLSVASYLRRPSAGGAGETRLVLNLGTGIKAPALYQAASSLYALVKDLPVGAGVAPIGPERSRSIDIGLEQGFAGSRARVRVAYFHNTFHDLIEFLNRTTLPRVGIPAAVANATPFGAYVNSQSYRAQGAELSFEAAPRPDLRLTASYTRLDAVVTKALSASAAVNPAFPTVAIGAFSPLVGARPFRRPANSGSLSAVYAPARFDVAVSAYVSGRRDDSTFLTDAFFGNSLLLPNRDLDAAYQKVDLSGSYLVRPRVRIYTSVENVLNRQYQAVFGYPALPITARGGVRLLFGGDRPARP